MSIIPAAKKAVVGAVAVGTLSLGAAGVAGRPRPGRPARPRPPDWPVSTVPTLPRCWTGSKRSRATSPPDCPS